MKNNQAVTPLRVALASCVALLAACASEPMGPTIQVYPAANKPFEVFQEDQSVCKQFADQQIAGQVDNANARGLGAAAIATAIGAGLGAAIGGGRGAGIGAAGGAIVGADVGSNQSGRRQGSIQEQYNNAYAQCMYSKGDQVGAPRVVERPRPQVHYRDQDQGYQPPPPPGYYPPPAQGYEPPPPPGY